MLNNPPILGALGLLLCPVCGGNYLHQVSVESYWREAEDSPRGQHTRTDSLCLTSDSNMAGNPSQRRDGILIHCRCENCEGEEGAPSLALAIVQHKGGTYVNWVMS